MSISTALNSALSGLTVTSRRAEIVSTNIANATTQGYARRELEVQSRLVGDSGQGVMVAGVLRHSDPVLLQDRRLSAADTGRRSVLADVLSRLEQAVGTPDSATSVSGRLAALESSLIAAAANPASESRLAAVADAARGLAAHMSRASEAVQTARMTADRAIATEVAEVNSALTRVAELNIQIRNYANSGRDIHTLTDQRQTLIDRIATIIPVREIPRDDGRVALYTPGSAMLVDARAVTIGFTASGVITPDMTLASGALAGLTLDDRPIDTGDRGRLSGGALGALFKVRDDTALNVQAQLDAVARDLVDRLADPALDASRAPGAAGLFTDTGQPFDPLNEVGLARRLTLNPAADPQAGGALWRLRDGLGAATPGAQGNSALLTGWHQALTASRQPASGGFMGGARTLSALTGDMISRLSAARVTAEGEATQSAARTEALRQMEAEGGVDTDQELQDLMLVEKAYAANARVVKTVDEMLTLLLGL